MRYAPRWSFSIHTLYRQRRFPHMFNADALLASELRSRILDAADVPAIDLGTIALRRAALTDPPRSDVSYARVAAAACVIAVAALFATGPASAVVQALEERARAALIASGLGWAPPPPPPAIRRQINSMQVTLAQARVRANFTIVQPQGLPVGSTGPAIFITPLAVYSKATGSYDIDGSQVTFQYRRANGTTFFFIADRYSPKTSWPRYLYDVEGATKDGKPIIVRRDESFAWRNGDQVLQISTGSGLSPAQIENVRRAMNGIALPRESGPPKGPDGRAPMYVIP
jgi:hypothetical protein